MTIEEELEALRKSAREFANIGDAKLAIETDEGAFNSKLEEVKRHFKYISYHTENNPSECIFDDRWLEACDIVGGIETTNPSLEKWVADIIALKE